MQHKTSHCPFAKKLGTWERGRRPPATRPWTAAGTRDAARDYNGRGLVGGGDEKYCHPELMPQFAKDESPGKGACLEFPGKARYEYPQVSE